MDEARLVLVTGGRDFADDGAIFKALDTVLRKYPNTTIIQGGCETGADMHARTWATEHERPCITVPAEWKKYGDAAGPKRNQIMLAYLPHACVEFDGGRGTADMVRRARAADVQVWKP